MSRSSEDPAAATAAAAAMQQPISGAPGGPAIQEVDQLEDSTWPSAAVPCGLAVSSASAAAFAEDDDDLVCVICLLSADASCPVWSCSVCTLVAHLECMREWLSVSPGSARCPGCQTTVPHEVQHTCWCRRVVFEEGHPHLHSCGEVCARRRPDGGCLHPCQAVCHRGPCAPCTFMCVGVPCLGGHQVFEPYLCGQAPICRLACGQLLPCGHECMAPCHAGVHPPCPQVVSKSCSCGRAINTVEVPCSQLIVQCDALCPKMRSCMQHPCERKCHIGSCDELMVVSAWNKNSWVKIGSPSPSPPAAVAVSAPANDDYPVLGSAVAAGSAAASRPSAPSMPPSIPAFRSCGKVCQRVRACGHKCTQRCHEPAPEVAEAPESESKEAEEDDSNLAPSSLRLSASTSSSSTASSSSSCAPPISRATASCEFARCLQPVAIACPCGRKTAQPRCFESASDAMAALGRCDEVCRVHLHGAVFFTQLSRASSTGMRLLPFRRSMLEALSSGGDEDTWLRKIEAKIATFVLELAASSDRPAVPGARAASTCLFLPGLTPDRLQIVAQLAIWHNLRFDASGEYLQPESPQPEEPQSDASASGKEGAPFEDPDYPLVDMVGSRTRLILPSMSLSAAAALLSSSPPSSVLTQGSWPASLVISLSFEVFTRASARATLLAKWLRPFRLVCRIQMKPQKALVLFASALHARRACDLIQAQVEVQTGHVVVEAPAADESTRAHVEAMALEQTELKRAASEQRQRTADEYEAVLAKRAKQQEERRLPSAVSALAISSAPALTLARSSLQGHTQLKVQSRNVFALLGDSEDEDEDE